MGRSSVMTAFWEMPLPRLFHQSAARAGKGVSAAVHIAYRALYPTGMKSKSSTGTRSKNALCSLCGKGHSTGVGCRLVYQLLEPPTQTVPGKGSAELSEEILQLQQPRHGGAGFSD